MKTIIATDKAPAAIGPYSQGVASDYFSITSGQLPIDPATGMFADGGITGQTRQSLENVKAYLLLVGIPWITLLKPQCFSRVWMILLL